MFVVTEQHGKRKGLSMPPKKTHQMVRAEFPLMDMRHDNRRETERATGRGMKWNNTSQNQQVSPVTARTQKRHKSDKVRHGWVTQERFLKSIQQPPPHISVLLSTSMSCCSAVQYMPATHDVSHCQDCARHFNFFNFFPLAVDTNEVHLTGKACQVQRQRRLMMDQSPMTHSSICDPRC